MARSIKFGLIGTILKKRQAHKEDASMRRKNIFGKNLDDALKDLLYNDDKHIEYCLNKEWVISRTDAGEVYFYNSVTKEYVKICL